MIALGKMFVTQRLWLVICPPADTRYAISMRLWTVLSYQISNMAGRTLCDGRPLLLKPSLFIYAVTLFFESFYDTFFNHKSLLSLRDMMIEMYHIKYTPID